ncbi:hypothetical protein HMPREF9193_00836 [Treponema lecithinolyticum ATCC 700332]|uniref:Uncharacterized protein n=1 Tax=Treponema lecithinolyticum ATCC 700332 TaxID=1321815 RepID=A0ABN0NZT2_TRELE|nr:hypothetical protein HMPREF9193_00836 [Treponema lecithinolyticum ATCC 700332]
MKIRYCKGDFFHKRVDIFITRQKSKTPPFRFPLCFDFRSPCAPKKNPLLP